MKKIIFSLFVVITFMFGKENQAIKKEEILAGIESYTLSDFSYAYRNVIHQLHREGNVNAIKKLKEKEVFFLLAKNYKKMLEVISYNESKFVYNIGLYDKNDLSYFQINIRNDLWNIQKLKKLTKFDVSRKLLIEDYVLSGKIAMHVMIYNIAIHTNYYQYTPSEKHLSILIGTYNSPIALNKFYIKDAKNYLINL